ncbi:transcriptional regulator [Streptomyces eurocidicus]|uniref:LysR family cyn operon transcriptional activator n=1 Tax=Streptomyces eurocidicus TaxID=66423 RepID=A0A2N8P0Y1_STREU|nr:transcriptional regulator CynR [Streptomyces eurocidicus]MBB5121788.1 LysR family cyn operon transcriptional activator [Streptomyces eurocidicus]MBF6055055.1 transcriptional regulator CynR [Streptomyces eurocidicus]PNE34664.1 transcriptional regulator [Streptomyces eurocidicus]
MELRHLRYLLAVAEHASFTRAAEALHISQPTLSQQVRQLEKELKAQLLDRTGRTVRLTDAGRAYTHYARSALRDLAAAERAVLDVRDLSVGTLRLAMTPTFTAYLIGPLVARFHARHPGVTLEVRELTQDRIESALLADEVDLGIAFSGAHLPGVAGEALFTEALSLVVGPGHPRAGGGEPRAETEARELPVREPAAREPAVQELPVQELPVRELAGHQLALLSGDFATRGHIDAYFAGQGVQPAIAVEANSINALTEIVRHTALATVLPDAITRDHPHLHPVPLDPPLPTRTVTLLRRESAYRSAAAAAFGALAHTWVRAAGWTRPGPGSGPGALKG